MADREELDRLLRQFGEAGELATVPPSLLTVGEQCRREAALVAAREAIHAYVARVKERGSATLVDGIEAMRSHEATPDDAPPQWGNSEAAAWAEGFAAAMQKVHESALGVLAARSAAPPGEERE